MTRGWHQFDDGYSVLLRFILERGAAAEARPGWLTAREWSVLVGRLVHRSTLRELGAAYGITGERVRQIERQAVRKGLRRLPPDPRLDVPDAGRILTPEQ